MNNTQHLILTLLLPLWAASLFNPTSQQLSPSAIATTTVPPIAPDTEAFWIKIEYRGGMIANTKPPGVIIRPDGVYFYRANGQRSKQLFLSKLDLQRLNQRFTATNLAKIKTQPFQGTCPIAYDGNEMVYTFRTHAGVEEISACKYQIPGNSLLFQQLNRIAKTASQSLYSNSSTP